MIILNNFYHYVLIIKILSQAETPRMTMVLNQVGLNDEDLQSKPLKDINSILRHSQYEMNNINIF